MTEVIVPRASKNTLPLVLLTAKAFGGWLKKETKRTRNWLAVHAFTAKPGTFVVLPGVDGTAARVIAGVSEPPSLWDLADYATRLPAGSYQLVTDLPLAYQEWLALGWALGAQKFTRYKSGSTSAARAKLVLPAGADAAKIERYQSAIALARNLITTPAEDKAGHPRITLVGKGVCFDTGGLDLKPSSSMYLMKKDMGGAACALAIAAMVMDAKLPVQLRLLIPAVENAVASNAFRPTDVIQMRSGLTVEVGNTDAEGRLILADALTEASNEKPELLIDFATLTGAARSALGTDLPALFCNDDALAERIMQAGKAMEDPLWRMPLYAPYTKMLESPVADINNAPNSPYAGAITAALFLERFVGPNLAWAHIDLMAWNLSSKPGRPEGGEAMTVRTIFRLIELHVAAHQT
jgi:leucyl aminopeptidase